MVFQDPSSSLGPRMTVGESIAEAIPRSGPRSRAARSAETASLLELVKLAADSARKYPGQLSGGQRQRVAQPGAAGGQPDVIIADEITSALDVSIQGTVLNLVRDLHRRLQLSMLFISHNLAVVRYVSDVIAVMYLGRIVECGPADAVIRDPQHPYLEELLAAAPARRGSSTVGSPGRTMRRSPSPTPSRRMRISRLPAAAFTRAAPSGPSCALTAKSAGRPSPQLPGTCMVPPATSHP